MNKEKYLPIGTVVMLRNGKKRVMITGFAVTAKETGDRMFDYMGCLYPEGVLSSDKNLLFDHEQIVEIHHAGLVDDEWKTVEEKIKSIVALKATLPKEEIKTETQSTDNMFSLDPNIFTVQEEEPETATIKDMFSLDPNMFSIEDEKSETSSTDNMFSVDPNMFSIEDEEEPETPSSENMFRVNTDLFN